MNDPRKIKTKDIKPLRQELLKQQGYLCAICREVVNEAEAVLDHCHKTGLIRSVLHRGCNAYIGHLENNQLRNRITEQRLAMILRNYTAYVQTTKDIIHPTHLTAEERALKTRKRRKKKRDSKRNP